MLLGLLRAKNIIHRMMFGIVVRFLARVCAGSSPCLAVMCCWCRAWYIPALGKAIDDVLRGMQATQQPRTLVTWRER
ncbi:hypothetical protein IWX91DRAFT_334699 [Phyllosticta citricarpa]